MGFSTSYKKSLSSSVSPSFIVFLLLMNVRAELFNFFIEDAIEESRRNSGRYGISCERRIDFIRVSDFDSFTEQFKIYLEFFLCKESLPSSFMALILT